MDKIQPARITNSATSESYEAPLGICSLKINKLIDAHDAQQKENEKMKEAIKYLASKLTNAYYTQNSDGTPYLANDLERILNILN
jgi:hypothetical protein